MCLDSCWQSFATGRSWSKRGMVCGQPATTSVPTQTHSSIGSLSKALTGVGVELLVEQGKLKLDEPASHYIKGLPKKWQSIPLKFFLAHQSGIPDIPSAKQPTFQEELRSVDNFR